MERVVSVVFILFKCDRFLPHGKGDNERNLFFKITSKFVRYLQEIFFYLDLFKSFSQNLTTVISNNNLSHSIFKK